MKRATREHLEKTLLSLLDQGGVDNWSWYGESLQEADVNPCDNTPSEVLAALEAGGVDNWSFYGEAIGEYPDYEDYVLALAEGDYLSYDEWLPDQLDRISREEAAEKAERERAEAEEAKAREAERKANETTGQVFIRNWVRDNYSGGDALTDKIFEDGSIWQRSAFTKIFDKAMKSCQNSGESFNKIQLQEAYCKLLVNDHENELKKFVDNFKL